MQNIIVGRSSDLSPIQIDHSMSLWPLVGGEAGANLDCVVTEINGLHSRRVNHRSYKLYFVTVGTLHFSIDGNETILKAGDVGIVPPGLACSIIGEKSRVVIVCSPPFNEKDEEIYQIDA